jgi:hypothetical protein
MKPKIAILTSLTDFAPAYSLVGIILDQARALKRNGYDYDLLCLKYFKKSDADAIAHEGLNIKYVLPQTILVDYKPTQPPNKDFEDQVRVNFEGDPAKGTIGYRDILKDYDTIITHDLMFLEWFLPMNGAIRKCIELYPNKNWLHWVHSGPSQPPNGTIYPSTLRYSAAPNSVYVFLNHGKVQELALMFKTTRDNISVVTNPKDIRDVYGFSQETCSFIDAYDLFNHDLLQIYPFSTPRWTSKGIKHLIRLVYEWKKQGLRTKVVLVNGHCNSPKDKEYLDDMENYVKGWGLELDKDIIMTSRFAKLMIEAESDMQNKRKWTDWIHCVPARVIRELNLMSNIFIFPSETECCSLIQAEASITGKFMVLNEQFAPMGEFCAPGMMQFEFNGNSPDDRQSEYYTCVAREIWTEFQTEGSAMNASLARNVTYNRDWIFTHQLEPLLWKKFIAKKPREKEPVKIEKTEEDAEAGKVILQKLHMPNYEDPQPGDKCGLFGACSEENKSHCYHQAGHCMMLDEELYVAK